VGTSALARTIEHSEMTECLLDCRLQFWWTVLTELAGVGRYTIQLFAVIDPIAVRYKTMPPRYPFLDFLIGGGLPERVAHSPSFVFSLPPERCSPDSTVGVRNQL
jgi:hypothetical protein